MDTRYTGEILKHLEKQGELLEEAKISMPEELHQWKVEEEMLMRKFYEIMSAHGKVKKNEYPSKVSDDIEIGSSTAIVTTTSSKNADYFQVQFSYSRMTVNMPHLLLLLFLVFD